MTRLEAIDALLEKVKAGECDFDWGFAASPSRKALPVGWHEAMNAFNGSLDAAFALLKAVLPEWGWTVGSVVQHFCAEVYFSTLDDVKVYSAITDEPSRALLIACLEALKAKEEANV